MPYAAEARWTHAVSLELQGRWDDALQVLDIEREVVPPIYARAADRDPRPRSWRRAVTPRASELARSLRSFWRAGGAGRDHRRFGRAGGLHEHAGDQAAAFATYRLIVDTLTSIWHPLFQARVRLAATTLAAFASGAAHRSADGARGRTPRSWPVSSTTPTPCSSVAASSPATTWGPESRAWEVTA